MPFDFWLSIMGGMVAAEAVLLAVRGITTVYGRISYFSNLLESRRERRILRQAKKGLAQGNEPAAIVLGFAALETALVRSAPRQSQHLPFPDLIQGAIDAGAVSPEQKAALANLYQARNQVVHPTAAGLTLQADAESYLHDVQNVLDEISAKSRRS